MPCIRRALAACSLALYSLLATPSAFGAENDTVVFIHGFLGWGRDEMLGLKYWGGPGRDFQEDLIERGVPAVTVAVGPVSSNWDRAVEAWHQLAGGCVDYGAAHAAQHRHARFGRCHEALLAHWDADHKINIVAHSQGGQTARVLAHLLAEGSAAERAASGAQVSPLFAGGKGWVRSVTTLSSPHLGTTLTKGVYLASFDLAEQLVGVVAAASGGNAASSALYDFKLDQWGLARREGESFASYIGRIRLSPVLQPGHTRDLSSWDLSPEGAAELNGWVRNQPAVYYFSLSTASTWTGLFTGIAYPTVSTAGILSPGALWMGSYRNLNPAPGEVRIDGRWATNDAVVNTISMLAPPGSTIRRASESPQRGAWTDLGLWDGWDHMDIIGHTWDFNPVDWRDPSAFYHRWGDYLKALH